MTSEKGDPYEVLAVSPTASNDEIKRVYRTLASELHPNGAKPDKGRYIEVTQAYEEINTDQKREAYAARQVHEAREEAALRAAQEHAARVQANKERRIRARQEAKRREAAAARRREEAHRQHEFRTPGPAEARTYAAQATSQTGSQVPRSATMPPLSTSSPNAAAPPKRPRHSPTNINSPSYSIFDVIGMAFGLIGTAIGAVVSIAIVAGIAFVWTWFWSMGFEAMQNPIIWIGLIWGAWWLFQTMTDDKYRQ